MSFTDQYYQFNFISIPNVASFCCPNTSPRFPSTKQLSTLIGELRNKVDNRFLDDVKSMMFLQKSHFIKSRGEPGRDHSLILLMPELWPARTSFTDPNAHKAPVRVSKELEEAAKWCTTAKNDNTVVVCGDGRDRHPLPPRRASDLRVSMTG